MRITPETLVKDALHSSPAARQIFIEHGVDVVQACRGMYDMVSLGMAEEWCHIKDLDGLMRKLQAAADAGAAAAAGKDVTGG